MEKLFHQVIGVLVVITGGILTFLALLLYGSFVWGFVFTRFSSWFIIPIFHGFPVLTYMQSVGLMFIINMFHTRSYSKLVNIETKMNWVMFLTVPWVTLVLGWIVSLFV